MDMWQFAKLYGLKQYRKSPAHFWGIAFILSQKGFAREGIITRGFHGEKIDPQKLFDEMIEEYMKTEIQGTWNNHAALFWAWADVCPEYYEEDHWNLRFQMMQYHFEKAMGEK